MLKIEHGEDRKELTCTNMHAWLDRQNKDEDAITPLYLYITKPFALSDCTKSLVSGSNYTQCTLFRCALCTVHYGNLDATGAQNKNIIPRLQIAHIH